MNRTTRFLATLVIALLLPLQGFAAACAQICFLAQAGASQAHDVEASDHCDKSSEPGANKCCKAHAFMIDVAVAHVDGIEPFQAHAALTPRWTSFIPEEPSPPPILPAATAVLDAIPA